MSDIIIVNKNLINKYTNDAEKLDGHVKNIYIDEAYDLSKSNQFGVETLNILDDFLMKNPEYTTFLPTN